MSKNTLPLDLADHIYASATDFAIFTLDPAGCISSWNVGAEQIFGYTEAEVIGKNAALVYTEEDRDCGKSEQEIATSATTGRAADYRFHQRKDGRKFWADGVMTPMRDARHEIIGFLKILRDITTQKTAQDEFQRQSGIDQLPGIATRATFDARTHEVVSLCIRNAQALQLLLIDLDRFKEVNDTLGHQAGDELLRQVAHRLKDTVGESDVLGRLGGDEFGLLQIGPSDLDATGTLAAKIVAALAQPYQIQGVDVHISASVGVASCPRDSVDPEDLLKKADLALYKAKNRGRNGFHHFAEELDQAAHKRNVDAEELRKVVSAKRLTLAYQPIVASNSGQVCAMEALVRFSSPILSQYTVDYVIDLAQEIGLMVELGSWVFSQACMQLVKWKDAGLGDLKICINTCAKELLHDGYRSAVEAALAQSRICAKDVDIELTERDAIDLQDASSDVLESLVAAGFALSLDDFGTGYSSLSDLRRLPVTTIKLDRSFLFGVPSDPTANAVARAVVTLAKDLNLRVIAEGVEEAEQAHDLKEIGCTAFQGSLFAQAMAVAPATAWLLAHHRLQGGARAGDS